MDVKFLIAGDREVSVEFGSVISLEVNAKVRALDEKIKESKKQKKGNSNKTENEKLKPTYEAL